MTDPNCELLEAEERLRAALITITHAIDELAEAFVLPAAQAADGVIRAKRLVAAAREDLGARKNPEPTPATAPDVIDVEVEP